MTLSNRSRFADDVVKESTPLCMHKNRFFVWMDRRAQPDPVKFVFCGNTRFKFKGREKKA